MAYAEAEFRLGTRQSDGAEMRTHLESAAEQMRKAGMKPKVAIVPDTPDFPSELGYLWQYFCELSTGLSINGMTYPTVTWCDVAAWSALVGVALEPWESRVMVRLGVMRSNVQTEQMKMKTG